MLEKIYIKDVALYLRKSRGEEDKDLEKHRSILTDLAKQNNWRFIEYVEIASSETIEYRPKFKQLLNDIAEGLYDAVLVVDYDRLGRGDKEEQGKIDKAFKSSETYIVTPQKIYNLNDESDAMLSDVQGLLARFEYNQIKKRMTRGKKIGSKLGNWTNGKPPFPYEYDATKKGLVVNEDKKIIYNELKLLFFDGLSFKKISWHLNNKSISAPNGGIWHENTVRRTLIDETHMGRIISGKSKGSGHLNKNTNPLVKIPRSEWQIVENCHEVLKTAEEHDQILLFLKRRKVIPDIVTKGVYLLSGLLFCDKCKKAILIQKRDGRYIVTKGCQYTDPYGKKCINKSIRLTVLIDAVIRKLSEYETELLDANANNGESEERLFKLIESKNIQIAKVKVSINRIREMYEDGEYSKDVYQKRLSDRKEELSTWENELNDLQRELDQISRTSNMERMTKISDFRKLFDDCKDDKLLNAELRKIVNRIEYRRETPESIDINISFL